MRVLFALLALAATTISANDVIKVEGPLDGNVTYYRTTPQSTTTTPVTEENGAYEADANVNLVFNLVGFNASHPFGFASGPGVAVSDYKAIVSAECAQFVDVNNNNALVFAWYPNTTTTTACTVTLPGAVNGTELIYRCAIHAAMAGPIRFATPTAVDTSSTGLNPSPIDSTGAAGSSTGGATPVPTPTPTPKPGTAAAQISGVVGLAVALISALIL